jgi:hypothetical protein
MGAKKFTVVETSSHFFTSVETGRQNLRETSVAIHGINRQRIFAMHIASAQEAIRIGPIEIRYLLEGTDTNGAPNGTIQMCRRSTC